MLRQIRLHRAGLGVSVLLAALAGCGGGADGGAAAGGGPAPAVAVASVPAEAGASVASFIAWQKTLKPEDSADPLLMKGFLPPSDDHAEPSPLG